MAGSYYLNPVGIVRKSDARIWVEIYDEFADGLLGLDGFSHIYVLFWFHENDFPEQRKVLQVHPRGDSRNPLTGVFGTHSPLRPNLIGLTLCKLVAVEGNRIEIEDIDAIDGTPIIDIKCYIPGSISRAEVRMPGWV